MNLKKDMVSVIGGFAILSVMGCGGGGAVPAVVLAFVTNALGAATFGQNYASQVQVSGGTPPMVWQIASGALPPGITFCNAETGATCNLGGAPTEWNSAPYNVTIKVTDSANKTSQKAYSVPVSPAGGSLQMTPLALPDGTAGTPYSQPLTVSSGLPTYNWAISGNLPPGIVFCTGATIPICTINGTPTQAGVFPFTVTVSDSNNPAQSFQQNFTIQVAGVQRTLSVTVSGNGTVASSEATPKINCGSQCSALYDLGAAVTLTASPNAGEQFTGWSGDCSGVNPVAIVSMTNDMACTGAFTTRLFTGPAGSALNSNLPSLPMPVPVLSDLTDDNGQDGTGLITSRTRILVVFINSATIGEVNALLASINASVAGTIPPIQAVLITIPDGGDFVSLRQAISVLGSSPLVGLAVQDVAIGPTVATGPTGAKDPTITDHSSDQPAGKTPNVWLWDNPPSVNSETDGNWGLEAGRVPGMWNLNDFAARRNVNIRTGVLDAGFNDIDGDGFNDHPGEDTKNLTDWFPFPGSFVPGANVHAHGQHVAGIIGALFNNGRGIDGINPFAERHSPPDNHFVAVSLVPPVNADLISMISSIISDLSLTLDNWPDLRVLNLSLGYNWGPNTYDSTLQRSVIDPNTSGAAQQAALAHGLMVRKLAANHNQALLVTAAGNDSSPSTGYGAQILAKWASPFNWAALGPQAPDPASPATLVPPSDNILVVESLDAEVANTSGQHLQWIYTKSRFSNVGGMVSAPGGRILSTVGNNIDGNGDYETFDGTSMAAPFVSGLAGYLLNLDDTLTPTRIIAILRSVVNTRPAIVRGGELPLPAGVLGPAPQVDAFSAAMAIDLLRANDALQKALVDVDDGTADGNQRTIRNDSNTITGTYVAMGTADDRRGDGKVSMADFRALRDAVIEVLMDSPGGPTATQVSLDGPNTHFKEDLSFDGCVGQQAADPPHPGGLIPVPLNCGAAADETAYPRYDFNGDGSLGPDAVFFKTRTMTDLEVFQSLWPTGSDQATRNLTEDYQGAELDSLIPPTGGSADLEFRSGLTLGGANLYDEIRIGVGGRALKRKITTTSGRIMWTVPIASSVTFTVEGYKSGAKVKDLCASKSPPLAGLRHGEDMVISVIECNGPKITLASSWEARQDGGGITIPEQSSLTQITRCSPDMAVGEVCEATQYPASIYTTGSVSARLTRAGPNEWIFETTGTSSAVRPPTRPGANCGDGTTACLSYSTRSDYADVTLLFESQGLVSVLLECNGMGTTMVPAAPAPLGYASYSDYISRVPSGVPECSGGGILAGNPWNLNNSLSYQMNSDDGAWLVGNSVAHARIWVHNSLPENNYSFDGTSSTSMRIRIVVTDVAG